MENIPLDNINIPTNSQNIALPGYGLFWVANSITSLFTGEIGRDLKDKASERNEEFQMEMRRAQEITDDKRRQEEYAFKRRLLDLSRQYRSEQTAIQFNNQMKTIELKHFLQYSWPLDPQLPFVLLNDIEKGCVEQHPKLNVILMHAPLLPPKKCGRANEADADLYKALEYDIMKSDVPSIGNLEYRKDAAFKNYKAGVADISGRNSNIMNIHFLMSQLPTLVISPTYSNDGLMHFSGAVWEPQAARPLIRPLFSINYNIYEMSRSNEYRTLMMNKFHAAVSVITGSVRDSYMMLTQGKAPTLAHWLNDDKHTEMKQLVFEDSGIKMFVNKENNNIIAALDERNSPRLLEAYSQAEIDDMKEQAKSINL